MTEQEKRSTTPTPELRPGENCWRTSRVERGSFLLDSASYFRAFREAVRRAEREVLIVAWDISESIEMVRRSEDEDGYPSKLADFLIAMLEEKPALRVRILLWDYSVIYLAEREWLPFTKWRQPGHPRLELVTDDAISAGASHHQKAVVIDGVLAFCGGIDLSAWRWDTAEHRPADDRRRNPKGEAYQPYHDVQMALTGPVVDELRELIALRWERAAGEELPTVEKGAADKLWPEEWSVDFEDEATGIALTFSRFDDYPPSEHIERLHLEVIEAARDFLYIENQYLSTHRLVRALCARLEEDHGPEVVLVLTREAGWAEESTLGVVRDRLMELLREADRHGRLAIRYPHAEDEEGNESQIYVHAKLLIADDRMLLLGSANLSNRSMRVDSELDLAFLRDEPAGFIRRLRERLLAMHFQIEADEVRRAGEGRSLVATIERLAGKSGNRLRVLEGGCDSEVQRKLADSRLLDPDEPLSPIHHVGDALRSQQEFWRDDGESPPVVRWLRGLGWIAGLVVVGLAITRVWSGFIDQERVSRFLEPLRDSPYLLPLLTLVFIVAGVVAVPINLVIIGATLTLGPWPAFGCGFVGALLAAAVSYGIGARCGKPVARRLAAGQLQMLSDALSHRGVLAVAILRVMPIAPFGVMNLVAGMSDLRFRVFMAGSAIGLLPGIATVTLATYRFVEAVENPGWVNWAVFAAIAAVILGGGWMLKRRFA